MASFLYCKTDLHMIYAQEMMSHIRPKNAVEEFLRLPNRGIWVKSSVISQVVRKAQCVKPVRRLLLFFATREPCSYRILRKIPNGLPLGREKERARERERERERERGRGREGGGENIFII